MINQMFYKLVHPLEKLYWFIFRPHTRGVRIIITHKDKILFVHHSYGRKLWTLPGGGMKKNEQAEAAVRRESKEEAGIQLSNLRKLGELEFNKEHKRDTVTVFTASVSNPTISIDNREISEYKWVDVDNPTILLSENVQRYLSLYKFAERG